MNEEEGITTEEIPEPVEESPIEKLERIVNGEIPEVFEEIQRDDSIELGKRISCSTYIKNAIDQLNVALGQLKS